jgi:hypothetical protein
MIIGTPTSSLMPALRAAAVCREHTGQVHGDVWLVEVAVPGWLPACLHQCGLVEHCWHAAAGVMQAMRKEGPPHRLALASTDT